MKKTILERSEDILKSKYITTINKIPTWMKGQKKLVEFARDAALYIIAFQAEDSAQCSERDLGGCSECDRLDGSHHRACSQYLKRH